MKNSHQRSRDFLSEEVIRTAVHGDESAVNKVLEHYSKYIEKLAARQVRDVFGNVDFVVDPYLKRTLET